MGRYDYTPKDKYDTPFFRMNPKALEWQKNRDREDILRADQYNEQKEALRVKHTRIHYAGPVYAASRIPFESCSSCVAAFRREADALLGKGIRI